MREELKLHVLREMLLENDDYKKVLSSIKKYQDNPTTEQKQNLITNLREKITVCAKELLSDQQIEKFIGGLSKIEDLED